MFLEISGILQFFTAFGTNIHLYLTNLTLCLHSNKRKYIMFAIYNSSPSEIPQTPTEVLSESIAGRTSEILEDKYYITRNEASQLNGVDFKINPQGLVAPGQNWDLTKNAAGEYLWIFSKTLQHGVERMLPVTSQVDQLLQFIARPTLEGLRTLPQAMGAERFLEDPVGGLGFEPIGMCQNLILPSSSIDIKTSEGAMEMTEVYCMALGRDLKISELVGGVDPTGISLQALGGGPQILTAQNLLDHMNFWSGGGGTVPNWPLDPGTGQTDLSLLFRGRGPGENLGQYVSQFLIQDIPFSNGMIEQKFRPKPDVPATVTRGGYIEMQNGKNGMGGTPGGARRIQSLRDIASIVHKDPTYGWYFRAALLGCQAGLNGLQGAGRTTNFLDTGLPDLLASLGCVSRLAFRTAWVCKWQDFMKIRPENTAARLAWLFEDAPSRVGSLGTWYNYFEPALISRMSQWNAQLANITDNTELPFLPQVYPEGSPTHPSFPAGHSTQAGACTTLLKAFLNTHTNKTPRLWSSIWGMPKAVDDMTDSLEDTVDSGETLIGELNKLCSNISLGRDLAGVHYRHDGLGGNQMGEEVAISYLRAMTKSYYPSIIKPQISFELQKFDGTWISIREGFVKVI